MCEKLYLHNHLLSHLDSAHLLSITPIPSPSSLESKNSDIDQEEKIIKLLKNNFTSSNKEHNNGEPLFFYKINLDKTIFHPQGGGQPSDEGILLINFGGNQMRKFIVKYVKLATDLIQIDHFGWFEENDLEINHKDDQFGNSIVKCEIDMEKRNIFTKIHSAGHILDLAIAKCGYNEWKPGRGYHFADSPYCEYYHCNQIPESIPKFIEQVNQQISKLLSEEEKVIKSFIPYYSNSNETINTELSIKFENSEIPSYLPPGQDVRFVKYGHIECACSGTHVDQFDQVGAFKVSKAKKQGQTIRISYNLF